MRRAALEGEHLGEGSGGDHHQGGGGGAPGLGVVGVEHHPLPGQPPQHRRGHPRVVPRHVVVSEVIHLSGGHRQEVDSAHQQHQHIWLGPCT